METPQSLKPRGHPEALLLWLMVGDSELSWAPARQVPARGFPRGHSLRSEAWTPRAHGPGVPRLETTESESEPKWPDCGECSRHRFPARRGGPEARRRAPASLGPGGPRPGPVGRTRRPGTELRFVGGCCGVAGQGPLVLRTLGARGEAHSSRRSPGRSAREARRGAGETRALPVPAPEDGAPWLSGGAWATRSS